MGLIQMNKWIKLAIPVLIIGFIVMMSGVLIAYLHGNPYIYFQLIFYGLGIVIVGAIINAVGLAKAGYRGMKGKR